MESGGLCTYNYLLAFLCSFHQKIGHCIVFVLEVLFSEGEVNMVQRLKTQVLIINSVKKYNHIDMILFYFNCKKCSRNF